MKSDGRRPRRVEEHIRARLSELFAQKLEDPSLAGLVVTKVSLSDDLSLARVFVRLLLGDEQEARRLATERALSRSSKRLRRALASKLGMRRVPELRFHYDTGHDAHERVAELLREIAEERGDA